MSESTIKCENCEEEFTDKEAYESHRELSHENDSFQFIDSRNAVDEQEFVRINGKREYNPNPNAGLYDNKLFREGSAKERTSILGEHHDGTDHEHPHEEATERQPIDGNDYWKNTYILPTGDDAYARCTVCGADVDTLTTDGDWMSDKEMLDHYDDHVSQGQITLYGESLDEEQSEDYLEARDELIADAIGSEKLGSNNPFKIGNEKHMWDGKTFTCSMCGKTGDDFMEMSDEICPEGNGGGHELPIFGDESKANEDEDDQRDQSELETDTSYEDEIYGGNSGNPDNWYQTEDGNWEVYGDGESYAKEVDGYTVLDKDGDETPTWYESDNLSDAKREADRVDGSVIEVPSFGGVIDKEVGNIVYRAGESYAKEDDYQHNFDELTSLAQDKIEDGGISQDTWDGSSKEERKDIESELHGDESWTFTNKHGVDYELDDEDGGLYNDLYYQQIDDGDEQEVFELLDRYNENYPYASKKDMENEIERTIGWVSDNRDIQTLVLQWEDSRYS